MAGDPEPFDVVVVGNAGVDTNVYLSGPLDLGFETSYTDIVDGVGQSGGYSARGFARLGRRTALLGYVGDDAMGRYLVEVLRADGVDVQQLLEDPAGTNRSVNVVYPDGRRHGFFDGGSHLTLDPDVAKWEPVLAGARLVHFSIPNWARRLLPIARAAGAVVSVDLQDVRDLADPYRADFVDAADVLFLSAVHLPDPHAALEALYRPGRLAVCTMGSRGCAVRSDAGYVEHAAVDLPLPVVDTTGAGDSLAAGLLGALVLDGLGLDRAVRRGQLAARWCCARRGSGSLVTRRELDDLDADRY